METFFPTILFLDVINILKAKLLIDQEQAYLLDSNFGKHTDLIKNFVNNNAGKNCQNATVCSYVNLLSL